MNYRLFKDEKISEIGLGTWQLGSADWGNVDEARAMQILETFTEAGGNFIDTADVYGNGTSEKVIGKYLKRNRHQIYVATKLGRRHDHGYGWPQNFSYESMKTHAERSLEHLGVEEIFLEQLHCIPADELKSGKVFDYLRRLQQDKLIRHWGVSVETVQEAMTCMEQPDIASLQIIFNLFRQHVADEIFSHAREKKIALIVRVPLASGLLTNKFTEETIFPDRDHRNYNAEGAAFNAGETFSGIPFGKGVKLAKEIAALLPDERTAAWAIRWILDHPDVTTVIPGASNPEQVNNNLLATSLPPLPQTIHDVLRNVYDEEIRNAIRGGV